MTAPLPQWAQAVQPVDMDGAALLLGVSRRFLVDVLRDNKHYERRGTKKVFYPEHIALLREALSCQTSSSKNAKEFGAPLALSEDAVYDRVLALAKKQKLKNSAPNSRRGNGNVIPMARKRSGPSAKQPSNT